MTKTRFQQLSVESIEQSLEIRDWLSQFNDSQQSTAKTLLTRLRFVSRDEYSHWLRRSLEKLSSRKQYALYSVRKLESDQDSYWDSLGNPILRPATSQGSEDFVYSLISNHIRGNNQFLDHPSLSILRLKKVRDFVLIDDSIGSGDRISGFLNAMLENPTFLSWWSFGWVKITIISFARSKDSEVKIITKVRGSDHGVRKFRKSSKIEFFSEFVYDEKWLEERWGENYAQIVELCRSRTQVAKWARMGYGNVLSNLIFHHSVPNNLPGVLWFDNDRWNGLMPGRSLPLWIIELLNGNVSSLKGKSSASLVSNDLMSLLNLVYKRVRRIASIAIRLNVDNRYAVELIDYAVKMGYLTPNIRLTKVGVDTLKKSFVSPDLPIWDYSLYIPSSWSADRAEIQPLTGRKICDQSADSVDAFASMDGDVGETSLERSDAKAAAPPFSVMPQSPAMPRENHDTDGPLGSKEW